MSTVSAHYARRINAAVIVLLCAQVCALYSSFTAVRAQSTRNHVLRVFDSRGAQWPRIEGQGPRTYALSRFNAPPPTGAYTVSVSADGKGEIRRLLVNH